MFAKNKIRLTLLQQTKEREALNQKGLSQNEHVGIHVPTHRQTHIMPTNKQINTTRVPARIALLVFPSVFS